MDHLFCSKGGKLQQCWCVTYCVVRFETGNCLEAGWSPTISKNPQDDVFCIFLRALGSGKMERTLPLFICIYHQHFQWYTAGWKSTKCPIIICYGQISILVEHPIHLYYHQNTTWLPNTLLRTFMFVFPFICHPSVYIKMGLLWCIHLCSDWSACSYWYGGGRREGMERWMDTDCSLAPHKQNTLCIIAAGEIWLKSEDARGWRQLKPRGWHFISSLRLIRRNGVIGSLLVPLCMLGLSNKFNVCDSSMTSPS